jgi:hypothetical protein
VRHRKAFNRRIRFLERTIGLRRFHSQFVPAVRISVRFSRIAYLHDLRGSGEKEATKDRILRELLGNAGHNGFRPIARQLLLVAFIPMLHRLARQVRIRCPALSPDDVTQHLVTALLECCNSSELLSRDSHFAFAIARLVRRNAFLWAARESRAAANDSESQEIFERSAQYQGTGTIERSAALGHFLYRCEQRRVLSQHDLALLVALKLDDGQGIEPSNAVRQRMKRILRKLRKAAQWPAPEGPQLRLF